MYATPHLEKLQAALQNEKLPAGDKPQLEQAIVRYHQWIADLQATLAAPTASDTILGEMVHLLNEYRLFIDTDLIFDSPHDFLYRQKGQLKLDNSVIEEFLPYLINTQLIPELKHENINVGPTKAFSAIYFETSFASQLPNSGMEIRTKDQDFAISRQLYIRASHTPDFKHADEKITNLAYVVAECKTNLDKTMFQEAAATAHDVKSAVPGAKYFLLCEWLDMKPVSTAQTDIDEVIILRKTKRLNSNIRGKFSDAKVRQEMKIEYRTLLQQKPLSADMFQRFANHIRSLLTAENISEKDVLEKGYF